jgi:hypothetical protein
MLVFDVLFWVAFVSFWAAMFSLWLWRERAEKARKKRESGNNRK